MRVGIKLWSSNPDEYVDNAGFADFVEVMAAEMRGIRRFARRPYSYTVHAPHESFGFSPLLNYARSKKLLERAVKAARLLKADWIIMHNVNINAKPNEKTAEEAVKAVVRLVKSSGAGNILIENSCSYTFFKGKDAINYFGYTPEHMKELLQRSGAGFCLDLEHVAVTSHHLGTDFGKEANALIKLKPDYFHLSGTRHATRKHHTSIFDSDIAPDTAKALLKKAGKPVCLETPIDVEQRKREVAFLKKR